MIDFSTASCPVLWLKEEESLKRGKKGTEILKEHVWPLGPWDAVGWMSQLSQVRLRQSRQQPTSQLFLSGAAPAYVSRSPLFDVKVLPHFYAPSLLDIHVWAHKLPVTKKSYAVHRSLHFGWQCRTNASPCAETKFCNPNGLPMGGDLEVTPITPAASSWILLLLATFTTKCRTPQVSLRSSPESQFSDPSHCS